ncbi:MULTISPECIES: hemin uptake protein HemP [Pararhodobacter]|uniref:Hemin uptake protein HemP n=1 Tax=Pararhodobacter aggregans TaxID=404875 RepID=A0A2T7UTI5_9RHOB|nr:MULTISPECIES: hemin uptake protein HemP [Pararhodobacter]MCA0203477.1 hemin uptake protein HemP [Pseudomonadota bacterium]PTX02743.1 hemin uptake protein hemP [Pararhodobacter aggregans]PVE47974.1 hemin uptake protein HemP [Pararhodobacter aggregans]
MSLYSQPDFTRAEAVPQRGLPVHSARALTKGGTQAQIELDGKVYDLRITRAGKLILTK